MGKKLRIRQNYVLFMRSWLWPVSAGHWLMLVLISALLTIISAELTWADTLNNIGSAINHNYLEKQLSLATGYETNRTLGDRWTIRGIYQLEYDQKYRFQTGISYNMASGYINAIFIDLGVEKIKESRYSARLKFLGNQYGEYKKAVNSIIPYMHWESTTFFIDAGYNFRFLNVNRSQMWNIFYYETDVAEIIPYYQFGLKITTKDGDKTLIASLKNFDAMYAGNLGAYRFHFNYRHVVNDKITAFAILDYWQSGGIVMANTYYKTTVYGGIEVKL